MTVKTRANLYSLFEDGDTLLADSFTDLIDSCVNLADVTAQSFASNVNVPNLAANSVSADSLYATNIFADKVYHKNAYIEMYQDVTATVADVTASVKPVLISTSAPLATGFTQSTGVITYTGVVTARTVIMAKGNITSPTVNGVYAIVIAVNGTALDRSEMHYDASAAVKEAFNIQTITELKPNDTIRIDIQKYSPVTSAAVEFDNFSIIAFPVNLG